MLTLAINLIVTILMLILALHCDVPNFDCRVFLFLGLVGMSYSLWMWIRNGVIIMIIDKLKSVFSAYVHLFRSTFVFAQTLSLSGFIPRVPPQQPGYFHLRCQPNATTR